MKNIQIHTDVLHLNDHFNADSPQYLIQQPGLLDKKNHIFQKEENLKNLEQLQQYKQFKAKEQSELPFMDSFESANENYAQNENQKRKQSNTKSKYMKNNNQNEIKSDCMNNFNQKSFPNQERQRDEQDTDIPSVKNIPQIKQIDQIDEEKAPLSKTNLQNDIENQIGLLDSNKKSSFKTQNKPKLTAQTQGNDTPQVYFAMFAVRKNEINVMETYDNQFNNLNINQITLNVIENLEPPKQISLSEDKNIFITISQKKGDSIQPNSLHASLSNSNDRQQQQQQSIKNDFLAKIQPTLSNRNNQQQEISVVSQMIYSGSQGWMHSQFNPQLDTTQKKEIYVLHKMMEIQFDTNVAQKVINQIDLTLYTREELVQIVCETMMRHSKEIRKGTMIIDKLLRSNLFSSILKNNDNEPNKQPSDIPNATLQKGIDNDKIVSSLNPILFKKDNKSSLQKFEKKQEQLSSIQQVNCNNTNDALAFPITKSVQVKQNNEQIQQQTCQICLGEYLVKDFLNLSNCTHMFCKSCVEQYLTEKLSKSEVLNIICLQEGCKSRMVDSDLIKMLNPTLFEKYHKLKKIMILNQDPSIRWCQSPDCETYMKGDRDHPCLECPKCTKKLCFLCNEQWHEGKCEDAMSKSLLQMKINLKVEQCPQCRGGIQKFGGCNHLRCWMCGYEFCWLCKKQYSKFHYLSWNIIGCPNQLFSANRLDKDEKCQMYLSTFWRFLIFIILCLIGGIAGLVILVCMIVVIAAFLPIILFFYQFKPNLKKLPLYKIILGYLALQLLGIVLYPINLFLCFFPGLCLYGRDLYTYILYIIFSQDMYNV